MSAVAASAQAGLAAALLDPDAPCPPGLQVWNGSDPSARLAVHRNNVVVSLVDALAEAFPVVRELVGDEFFRAMAALFVRQCPPRSCVLSAYGAALPGFIEDFAPARSVPYLADIARLEAARVRAWHAADTGAVPDAVVALALASGERIEALRLACHPSVAVIESDFAIVSLWAAHQGDGGTAIGAVDVDRAESACVLRDGLDVLVQALPRGAAAFVTALLQSRGFGAAASAGAAVDPGFDLPATLALLLRHRALASAQLPTKDHR